MTYSLSIISILAQLFLFIIGLGCLFLIFLYFKDRRQKSDAILRNYPVIGHFRYILSTLGEFFRQYFFAMDREEMPFNRAERDWIERARNDRGTNVAFGSTKNLNITGSHIFVNAPYPTQEYDAEDRKPVIFGEHTCKHPYAAKSMINISAMSYGSLSKPAVRALSQGAKKAGCWLNTGEGGLSEHHLSGGTDIVFQMGTAKYGARDTQGNFSPEKLKEVAAHDQVKMIEIKLAQGAKPGKGGILPAEKVTEEIARIRGITIGEPSISPNRHIEIGNNHELLDFIHKVRDITGKPTGFKTVISSIDWIEDLCQQIHKRGIASAPDFITLDGGDGGTGAAPMTLMDNVGLPVKQSLPMLVDTLNKYGLKSRIKVITSGKLINPVGVAWALCAGADVVNSARGFMFALGCIQSLKCHKNTCPTGITTHDRGLQKGLIPEAKADKVANYVKQINKAVHIIAHSCGVTHPGLLNRSHVRLVQNNGLSEAMSTLHPDIETLPAYR